MLTLVLPSVKIGYNENPDGTCTFIESQEKVFHLEHCLLAMAKWESETRLCFGQTELKGSQITLYLQCMAEEPMTDQEAETLRKLYGKKILDYIYSDRCAEKPVPKYVTDAQKEMHKNDKASDMQFQPTEQIYAAMFDFRVPLDVEKWHFSRLLSLFKYISEREKQKEQASKGKGRHRLPSSTSPSALGKMESMNGARQAAAKRGL